MIDRTVEIAVIVTLNAKSALNMEHHLATKDQRTTICIRNGYSVDTDQ